MKRGRPRKASPAGGKRAQELGLMKHLGVEVPSPLMAALAACAAAERRSHKAIVGLALERYLAAAGHWPPAEGGQP